MFAEYFNEIIALVAIVVVMVVYLFIKKTKTPSESKEDFVKVIDALDEEKISNKNKEIEVVDDLYDASIDDELIQEDLEIEFTESLSGDVEGDFGVEETQEITPAETKKTINKRPVAEHAKITKQNFKEFAGVRILVAEDNLINQKVLTGLLADSGIELVLANDGKEALDILEKDNDFLMVLMDAHMPRIDGFEATRNIRANPKYDHIVVVALSGDTAADDVKKMHAAGMSEHLEKPLRMDALYNILYAYTGEHEVDDNDYVNVIMTSELNGDKGLAICGGDENFYMEILNEFVATYAHSADQLNDLLLSENFKEADKLLLDILGISANIGAEPLNLTAKDLKDALQDTTEKSYLTLIEPYTSHLDALLKDIHEYQKK